MVQERRPVDLSAGANHLRLGNVSATLDPSSVMFTAPNGSHVVSTTYDLGVGNNQNLIRRLAGKEVELIWASTSGHEGDRIKGKLEPTADGGFLLRTADKVYINPAGTLVAPADSDVATLPGLAVQIESDRGAREELGVSYLTRGLSWSADYVAHLDPATSKMSVECWASVENKTGIPYRDAKIAFVAGSPNRAVREPSYAPASTAAFTVDSARMTKVDTGLAMQPQSIGELYEYKPKDKATIGVDQISRVRMFEATKVPVHLDYGIRLNPLYAWGGGEANHQNAQLSVSLDNKTASGLGMPMPSGSVRIFLRDGDADRYTGADTLGDVPVDGHVNLTLSKVFDVTADSSIVRSKRVDKHTERKTLRVILKNAKATDVEVRVVQAIGGKWTFASGEKPEKIDAATSQWKVRVPAHGKATLESTLNLKG
ncbi:hypothetical protein OP10G_1290 [Fimbriimonas ginsengisoli Gsoil 348]|uniref:DUF4139 domain-containing protein n=2 Tax=Fimbriimonas ginsengisoli TaxID=1005039 RepID=A0A068NM69_FIMGI|nr:hypothetical protein OP10G_1290 [Fimbriimonas ginsengisoli Gsoil 348]